MTANFQVNGIDTDDLFVRRDRFTEGGLWSWGDNILGGLGDNTRTHRSSPVQTVSGGSNWKQVSVGYQFTAAIKTDGSLWSWGSNVNGALGDTTNTNRSSPVQTVTGGNNWKQVSAGSYHTAAVKTDGSLWVWGRNIEGQLGNGNGAVTTTASPIQTVSGGTNWKQVSCGYLFTACIKTDGTLWLWGFNDYGQLGDNSVAQKSSPVQVTGGGTNWKQVSAGSFHTAAIKSDGTLWSWGLNANGQLGRNDTIHRSTPVQTISGGTNWKQVSAGGYITSSIKTDGTLWLWGDNSNGQLGDNSTVGKSSPVQTIDAATNWKQVSGGEFTTAAIKTDGTLWLWGQNDIGQIGINDRTPRSSPVQTVSGGSNWKQVDLDTVGDSCSGIREDFY